jgi:pimeloyl-ACP methyl ester carboxylesterase
VADQVGPITCCDHRRWPNNNVVGLVYLAAFAPAQPSWYQVSGQDRMILPQSQRWMAERIHARETIELDTSHASFATRPTRVLELITNVASAI